MTEEQRCMELKVFEAIATSMAEHGYPGATPEMIRDIRVSYDAGVRGRNLPHGAIGLKASRKIELAYDMGILEKESF